MAKNKNGSKKPEYEEADGARSGFNINVWVSTELGEAFEKLRRKSKRKKNAEIEMALEAWLSQHGAWPPKEE